VLAAQLDPSTALSWSLIQRPSSDSGSAWLSGIQAINQIRIVLVGPNMDRVGRVWGILNAERLSTSLLWLRAPGVVSASVSVAVYELHTSEMAARHAYGSNFATVPPTSSMKEYAAHEHS